MKQMLCILLSLALLLGLFSGCGQQNAETPATQNTTDAATLPPETEPQPTDPTEAMEAPPMSVSDLEEGINEQFSARGIPVTCTFYPNVQYGQWRPVFRFTTLEDPDYQYPEAELQEGDTQEIISRRYNNELHSSLSVSATDPTDKDALISYINIDGYGWDQPPQTFYEAFNLEVLEILCAVFGWEAYLETFLTPETDWAEGEQYKAREFNTEQYYLQQVMNRDSEYTSLNVYSLAASGMQMDYPTGEALLDPQLLAFDFRLSEPILDYDDKYLFGYETFNTDQMRDVYFMGSNEMNFFSVASALADYLTYTCSQLFLSYNSERDDDGLHYEIRVGDWNGYSVTLDQEAYGLSIYNDAEVFLYYDVDVTDYYDPSTLAHPVEKETILRMPIGLALLLDEGMTPEEAVQLHTHVIEHDYVDEESGVQVTVYGPRDVVHVLQENPETGENSYFVWTRGYFDYAYGHLTVYLDD